MNYKIKNISFDNIIKLVIAEQIVGFKNKGDYKTMEKRLNMLALHIV